MVATHPQTQLRRERENTRIAPPRPIHLGYRIGREGLLELPQGSLRIGVSHVALKLEYGRRAASEVLEELGAEVVPRLAAL